MAVYSDHHGHRQGRRSGPLTRPGTRRRRLYLQTVQPREVVARVKAVLRRSQAAADAPAEVKNAAVVLNDDGWQALAHGQDIGLTAVEFQLLRVMMQAPGRIFSREQLMDHMYRDNRIVSERTVDSHIKKLRKKIHEALPELEIIRSVYGVGYKYQPEG